MKIVNRITFLALPSGTLFSKYTPCSFGDLCIKGDTLPVKKSEAGGDFLSFSLPDAIAHTSSEDFMNKLFAAQESGGSMPMDFDSSSRDGMFDVDELFAVWEWPDVFGLIARLQHTLPAAEAIAESRKFESFRQVAMCDGIVHGVVTGGGSAADCVVALANQKNALIARIMELESIAPKKILLGDGSAMVWHCPDHLIPETKS